MKPGNDVAIRKRTQIAKANRTMFIWIAIASALIGSALVVSIFMAQKLFYNEKVLAEKQTTVSTLDHNNSVVSQLQEEIRVLDTNVALSTIKASESDQAIQVILDALPSEANSFAFGASLQNKLLAGVDGLTLDTLQVDPVVGVETLTGDDTTVVAPIGTEDPNQITFQFTVRGSQDTFRQVLRNLERSIRTVEVMSVRIEIQSSGPQMTVQGRVFYEPAKSIELKDKAVAR
jgi:hypothetical protein